VKQATEAKRDRVYCAQALLDILEEPADLTGNLVERKAALAELAAYDQELGI
jgi:hypothetical protein